MTECDDMTLAEAQAEAERRWPGCLLVEFDPTYGVMCQLVLPGGQDGEGGRVYNAGTPVGCLDQAIASEKRKRGQEISGDDGRFAEAVALAAPIAAEARRLFPGAQGPNPAPMFDDDGLFILGVPGPSIYVAYDPQGCLDQALAAEARKQKRP